MKTSSVSQPRPKRGRLLPDNACPECGTRHDIFSTGAGEQRALALGLPFLGAVPLHPNVRAAGDEGRPVVATEPDSPYAQALRRIAGHLAQRVSIQTIGAS